MPLFTPRERALAAAVSRLAVANPFLPERVEAERVALGPAFVDGGAVWSAQADPTAPSPNVRAVGDRVVPLVESARARLDAGVKATSADLGLYADVAQYLLFDRYDARLQALVGRPAARVAFYDEFAAEHARLFARVPGAPAAAHVFASIFQIRRAFHHLFAHLLGGSLPAARVRAAAWQSIFTHDLRRYQRALFSRMHDVPTLVTGPTGTGKELVARAIGLSRYVPFDAATRRFEGDPTAAFHALSLSAVSPALVESELFGHRRGSFTGAVEDRKGWLELCPPSGTLFLDEIGELDGAIQVKLLRVLQTRSFQRLGESTERTFAGKLIAATHRDLAALMRAGRFREDLYYRICADHVTTPSLREQLDDAPGERRVLVRFIAEKVAGPTEADALADEVEAWIDRHLPAGYAWSGNVRELEQCVRSVLVRRAYRPPARDGGDDADALARDFLEGRLSADAMARRYLTIVHAQTGSYSETARRLGVDRRTVAARVDRELLARLRSRGA
jgi:transcriptional regulator of acetoin/glycerol metabolism